jgi:hypothetical protein
MPVCDVCEKELTPKWDTLHLYVGKVGQHTLSKSMLSTQSATTFERFKPVDVTVCSRHRKELFRQRIMPAVISFVLLFIPIGFLISLAAKLVSITQITQYVITALIAALLSYLLTRQITYDGLVAILMTRQSRGLGVEYLTEKKFKNLMKRLPERQQRALTRTPGAEPKKKKNS